MLSNTHPNVVMRLDIDVTLWLCVLLHDSSERRIHVHGAEVQFEVLLLLCFFLNASSQINWLLTFHSSRCVEISIDAKNTQRVDATTGARQKNLTLVSLFVHAWPVFLPAACFQDFRWCTNTLALSLEFELKRR